MNEMSLLERLGADIVPDQASLIRARRRLLRHALAPVSRRRRQARRMAILVACVVVAVGAVLTTAGPHGAESAAATVLKQAAALEEATALPGHDGYRFVRVETTRWRSEDASTTVDEYWLPADPAHEMVTRWEGGEVVVGPSRQPAIYTAPSLTVDDVLDWLDRPTGDLRGTEAAYERAGAAMVDPAAPPAFKALMFQAISRLQGVKVLEGSADFHGRTATVLGLDEPQHVQFAFDHETGEFLGIQAVNDDGSPAYSSLITDQVVRRLPARATAAHPDR